MRMLIITVMAAMATTACSVGRSPIDVTPDPVSLPVFSAAGASGSITSARSAFEDRRIHSAAGQFITRDVLAANVDTPLSIVLKGHLTGFLQDAAALPRSGQNPCLDVYLNGFQILDLLDTIRPGDLYGVEYYQAASAPVAYRRTFSTCPVLLLWLW